MKRLPKKGKAADFVIRHKICCLLWYIERRIGILQNKEEFVFLKKERTSGIPRLKGRVLPGQRVFDQPNVTGFDVHNIAPSPQRCGWHTRQQELHFNIIVKTAACCLCHKY